MNFFKLDLRFWKKLGLTNEGNCSIFGVYFLLNWQCHGYNLENFSSVVFSKMGENSEKIQMFLEQNWEIHLIQSKYFVCLFDNFFYNFLIICIIFMQNNVQSILYVIDFFIFLLNRELYKTH